MTGLLSQTELECHRKEGEQPGDPDARVTDLLDVGVGFRTVAAMARERAPKAPRRVAMREKDFGIWH
jgi:hypothetical protein